MKEGSKGGLKVTAARNGNENGRRASVHTHTRTYSHTHAAQTACIKSGEEGRESKRRSGGLKVLSGD